MQLSAHKLTHTPFSHAPPTRPCALVADPRSVNTAFLLLEFGAFDAALAHLRHAIGLMPATENWVRLYALVALPLVHDSQAALAARVSTMRQDLADAVEDRLIISSPHHMRELYFATYGLPFLVRVVQWGARVGLIDRSGSRGGPWVLATWPACDCLDLDGPTLAPLPQPPVHTCPPRRCEQLLHDVGPFFCACVKGEAPSRTNSLHPALHPPHTPTPHPHPTPPHPINQSHPTPHPQGLPTRSIMEAVSTVVAHSYPPVNEVARELRVRWPAGPQWRGLRIPRSTKGEAQPATASPTLVHVAFMMHKAYASPAAHLLLALVTHLATLHGYNGDNRPGGGAGAGGDGVAGASHGGGSGTAPPVFKVGYFLSGW